MTQGYTVEIRVSHREEESDIHIIDDIYAESPMQALGILLRRCQQIPKALDAVDPKNIYRDPA